MTLVTFRGVVGIAAIWCWLRVVPPRASLATRERRIALALGLLFGANVLGVFKAIELVPVPIAILAYFVYPLLTGLGAAVFGLERLGWRAVAIAATAFVGLALMIGAHPGQLAAAGLLFAFGAACCRTALLLITRACLGRVDARVTTLASLASSTVILVAWLAAEGTRFPHSVVGWAAFLGTSVTTTIAVVALFAATVHLGAFRTALMMNLEPVLTTALSIALLGDSIGAVQIAGAGVMIGALCLFQVVRSPGDVRPARVPATLDAG